MLKRVLPYSRLILLKIPPVSYTHLDVYKRQIEYYAIFTDEEGMPMIPDMESYKEALLLYLIHI